MKYLRELSKEYRNHNEVIEEILNLKIILSLPKGTEFFFSDLHGEYRSFIHLLKSASGVIKHKIDLLYQDRLTEIEKQRLAHIIYYPDIYEIDLCDVKRIMDQLVNVAKYISSKYSRSKVNKRMPKYDQYIIQEMLYSCDNPYNKKYYDEMMDMIIEMHHDKEFIINISEFIRNICIDEIHIIGDLFDRGPRPDLIIEELMKYDDVDFEWGNHDISWIGAYCGNLALVANVVRISMNYNNLDVLEDGYGINLRMLSDFARKVYGDDPCTTFFPHVLDDNQFDPVDISLVAKMHKAITIIQLKLEGQQVKRHPEYNMEYINWLDKIDYVNKTLVEDGKKYELTDTSFPTVQLSDPTELTEEETCVIQQLAKSFNRSEKLKRHLTYIMQNGGMYRIKNGNVLYHGCIPMTETGEFKRVLYHHVLRSGKNYLDALENSVNQSFYQKENIDDLWYLWAHYNSPLSGKSQINIFDKYFLKTKVHEEKLNPYYDLVNQEELCQKILEEFGLNIHTGHIINGHVPVKIKDGESPLKGNGKLIMIDGGISKAYQSTTGIAGYTLIFDSRNYKLATHRPYHQLAKEGLYCLSPEVEIIDKMTRILNKDCDNKIEINEKIKDLSMLLSLYQKGIFKENVK